jgi:hypothetical protein
VIATVKTGCCNVILDEDNGKRTMGDYTMMTTGEQESGRRPIFVLSVGSKR